MAGQFVPTHLDTEWCGTHWCFSFLVNVNVFFSELTLAFTFRVFRRRFYPKRLTISTFILRRCFAVGTIRMFIEPRAKH